MTVQTSYSTNMQPGFPGMLADMSQKDVRTFASGEATAEIPFGVMVAQGANDVKAILMAGSGAIPVGVVLASNEYAVGGATVNGQLGTTGIRPKNQMNVLNRGRVWVTVEEAVNINDIVYVRHTASGGNTQLGAFRKSANTATALIVKGARYVTTQLTAGGLAVVELNMPVYFAVPT